MHPSTELVEPGLGRGLDSRNLDMNHSSCKASSGRSTDSSEGSNTGCSKVL